MARISEETIQRVVEASDIVEVVGSYFPLKRAGTSWRALCPFHREKTPSFHVNPQRQSFHCFGCGAGGTVVRFVMDYEHLDFPTAVRRLAQRAGIPVQEESGGADDHHQGEMRRRLLALHTEAAGWFHQSLISAPEGAEARKYLKSRGISATVAKSWQLGYAPNSWDALLNFLRGRKFGREEIVQSGLAASKDDADAGPDAQARNLYARFRDRVMFPIRNDLGEVIAFSGRVLDPDAKAAKYVNSPETPLFRKGRVLYGLDKSKRALIEANSAIVCEGQLDLITAYEAGVQNVIAPQGTAFTVAQARLLRRFVETAILCFDSDRAGQEAISRSLPVLLGCGLEARVARLPHGADPDSFIRGQGAAAFREAIAGARNFFDDELERLAGSGALETPAGKAAAARRLGPFLAALEDPVLREATIKRVCARLGIAERALLAHVKRTPAPDEDEAERTAAPAPLVMPEGIRLLCRLALADEASRQWLAAQKDPPLETWGEAGALLGRILASPQPLAQPAARTAFLAQLDARLEGTLTGLDLERLPEEPLTLTQDAWNGLCRECLRERHQEARAKLSDGRLASKDQFRLLRQVLQEKLDETMSRLLDSNLNAQERSGFKETAANLEKQILDLQSRLHEF